MINALWGLLGHDFDHVLKGAANGGRSPPPPRAPFLAPSVLLCFAPPPLQVINALWRLLGHDLDRVLKGSANGALQSIRDQADGTASGAAIGGGVTVEEAAMVLGAMAKVFMVSGSPGDVLSQHMSQCAFVCVEPPRGGGGCMGQGLGGWGDARRGAGVGWGRG